MHTHLMQLRSELLAAFPERTHVVDGSLAALLAGEHVLLIGPPGTAKSALVRSISNAFGARTFEILLTKFTTVDEVWGPISLRELENDRFVRMTKGRLPDCEIGFVDEVFRASSAILNALLTIANERIFHNDGVATPCPLISLFGATNNMHEGNELSALFDRFLLRFDVQYLLVAANIRNVLTSGEPTISTTLTLEDLRRAQAEVARVKLTDETVDTMLAVRDACKAEGIIASDRRWKRCIGLLRASAWLAGEQQTSPEDVNALVDALWQVPRDRPKVARLVGSLADPASAQCAEIRDASLETASRVTAMKSGDRKAFVGHAAAAMEQLDQQYSRLTELSKSAGRRARAAINDALVEVQGLRADMARQVSAGLGIGIRSVS